MLHIGEGHVSVCLPGAKPPYRKHLLTLSRGSTGRLKIEIESFRPGETGVSRIEMGPLHKFARTLKDKYSCTGAELAASLEYCGCSARLIAEVCEDMALPIEAPEHQTLEAA